MGSFACVSPSTPHLPNGPPNWTRTSNLAGRSRARILLRLRRIMVGSAGVEPATAGFGDQRPQSLGDPKKQLWCYSKKKWWTRRESNPHLLGANQMCSHYHYAPGAGYGNRTRHDWFCRPAPNRSASPAQKKIGAGDANRTHLSRLAASGPTTRPHPHFGAPSTTRTCLIRFVA